MKKLVPAPWLSLVLWLVWLLLNNTVHPAHVVLGGVLALAVPLYTERLRPDRPRLAKPGVVVRLAAVVLWDIVVANIEVARRILGPEAAIRPSFAWVPLDIRDPTGIAVLAGVVTMTPGTLSAEVTPDRGFLLVHAFNVVDGAALAAQIKRRYEAPLLEIFA